MVISENPGPLPWNNWVSLGIDVLDVPDVPLERVFHGVWMVLAYPMVMIPNRSWLRNPEALQWLRGTALEGSEEAGDGGWGDLRSYGSYGCPIPWFGWRKASYSMGKSMVSGFDFPWNQSLHHISQKGGSRGAVKNSRHILIELVFYLRVRWDPQVEYDEIWVVVHVGEYPFISIYSLWLLNIAMETGPWIVDEVWWLTLICPSKKEHLSKNTLIFEFATLDGIGQVIRWTSTTVTCVTWVA